MSDLKLENLDQRIGQLPSLPAIIARLLSLLQDEDISMATLTGEIIQDQALTVRILRVANSPFYGLPSHIDSLQQAGTLLGFHTIQGIITATAVMDHFPHCQDTSFDRVSFWKHAIGTGISAQVLARYGNQNIEQAFTAGLLHDVGKLVLAVYFVGDFKRVLAWRDEHDCLIRDAEQAVLGFDHAEIGARVTRQWKLPNELVVAIESHHDQAEKPSVLAELVHVADIVTRGLAIGHGGDDLIPIMHPHALTRLGLDWTDLQSALPEIVRLNEDAGMMLNFPQ